MKIMLGELAGTGAKATVALFQGIYLEKLRTVRNLGQ
jgi:hypothetical protein